MFLNRSNIGAFSWQAFERSIARLLLHEGYDDIRVVGQSRDGGADIIATRQTRRWLFQVKHWRHRAAGDVLDKTVSALRLYRATVPVVVALGGFTAEVREQQRVLMSEHTPIQLWDGAELLRRAERLPDIAEAERRPDRYSARQYQEDAIQAIARTYQTGDARCIMIVLATGLGKTFVAAEAIRRLSPGHRMRILAIAHTNDLVYQLERAFWPFLSPTQATSVWNGYEKPSAFPVGSFTFASVASVYEHVRAGRELERFDLVLVDECHHVGAEMYPTILTDSGAGGRDGPFLLGLTATPWRADDVDLRDWFGEPLVTVDLVEGLRRGFLTNVDYRIYTDNIDWRYLSSLKAERLSPRSINRTLFINQWDDAVVSETRRVWEEQQNPRALVFCGTIDHARTMADKLNALGFCSASALFSASRAVTMDPPERARILADFHDGRLNVLCVVDVFNEGIDVPDVNIIVFQRVTHSRRIFIQQLGRGLRIAPGKIKVIVLDFVSDIRRFAAGLSLKDSLESANDPTGDRTTRRVQLPNRVTFRRAGQEDPKSESFLRQWLEDVAAVESAGEDAAVLKFPPLLDTSQR